MMAKKKQQKKNRLKSWWMITIIVIVASITTLLVTVQVVWTVKSHNDRQKSVVLDREMYAVYERINKVDPAVQWNYDKGCLPQRFFPSGIDQCFVRISLTRDVNTMQDFIDMFKKYEASFNENDTLRQIESADDDITKYDLSSLRRVGLWARYNQTSTDMQCDYTGSLLPKGESYIKDGDIIDSAPARSQIEFDCTWFARDFWYPRSNKPYSSFD